MPRAESVAPLREDELDGCVVDRIREVAARRADHPAARSPGGVLTFRELDRWSDVLADRLLDLAGPAGDDPEPPDGPVGPVPPVAVLLGHEPSAVVAIVAILKAGRTVLPLDVHAPPDRLTQILELAGATVCVSAESQAQLRQLLSTLSVTLDVGPAPSTADRPRVPRQHIDYQGQTGAAGTRAAAGSGGPVWTPELARRVRARAPRRSGTDPAVVLFTSGSTGAPKGVVWTHSTMLFHVWSFQETFGVGPDDRIPLLLPYSFVSGTNTISRGLQAGATLDMFDPRTHGVRALAEWLRETRPTSLLATPALLRSVFGALEPDEVLPSVRHVISIGDATYARDILGARPHVPASATFATSYGSSESGISVAREFRSDEPIPEGALPSGWPMAGKQVTVVREDGSEAAPGESGEVVVVGRHLSGGYWRSPEQTATRFGVTADGLTSYRSGDVGRLDADGCLVMTGRQDAAVKVRGYLVEPIEIESALLASAEVADAVVVADRTTEPVRIVAYVVPARGTRPSPASIRRLLRARLPAYMVPATVVTLPALPRTDRGKVDRLALPPAPPALAGDPPRDQHEAAVAALWERVLNLESVGIHDDFVELGGDSLAAEEVAVRLAEELGVRLPTSTLAQAPTVAELAAITTRVNGETLRYRDVAPLQTDGDGAPLFCFAGAGGLAIGMLGLARHFAGERPVYGLQAHGLEHRGIPDWSVRAAARRHVPIIRLLWPRGPYLLLGHSFGGLVALEAARLLREAGQEVALLALVDTYLPGGTTISRTGAIVPSRRPDSPGHAGPDPAGPAGGPRAGSGVDLRVLADRARQLAVLPLAGLVRFPGMRQYDVFYNQGRVLTMAYRPEPWPGRALVWLADEHPTAPGAVEPGLEEDPRPVNGPWATLLRGPAVVRTVAGNHDSVLREPLVSQLAADIRAELTTPEPTRRR